MNKIEVCGYTLIELLVVVGIMIMLMGGAILALNSFSERKGALADARLVVDHLRAVRVKATAVEIPAACLNGVLNFTVRFSGETISTEANCVGGVVVPLPAVVLDESIFKAPLPTLIFVAGDGGIGTLKTVRICGNGTGYKVEVAATGVVAQPVLDPTACL
jgi:hypothetical protein